MKYLHLKQFFSDYNRDMYLSMYIYICVYIYSLSLIFPESRVLNEGLSLGGKRKKSVEEKEKEPIKDVFLTWPTLGYQGQTTQFSGRSYK